MFDGDGSGYAQPGKPVAEYLGLTPGKSLAIDVEQGELLVTISEGGDLSYSAYTGSDVREYAQFTLGSAGISALNASPGDTLRVETAAEETVRITVAEVEDSNE